jgi:hypothetical protein
MDDEVVSIILVVVLFTYVKVMNIVGAMYPKRVAIVVPLQCHDCHDRHYLWLFSCFFRWHLSPTSVCQAPTGPPVVVDAGCNAENNVQIAKLRTASCHVHVCRAE